MIRSRSIVSSTAAASKRGSSTCSAPTHVHASRFAIPATWNIGHTCSQRWSARWPVAARLCCALASRLPWLSITPFGRAGRAAGVGDGGERVGRRGRAARRGGPDTQVLPRRRARQPRSTSLVGDRGASSSASSAMNAQLLGREAVVEARPAPRPPPARPATPRRARASSAPRKPTRVPGARSSARQPRRPARGSRRANATPRRPYSRAARRSGQPRSLTAPAAGPRSPSARAAAPRRGSSSFSKSASQRSGVISG